ncbi:two-component sensor histidine kinase [Kitasatospora herbaricolor]|uniref:sensor histidine kinase n=1 Tax=Kitasatospora herbaricolor TaxID=68217 RepID=UPI0017491580|nr:HAMP domain-containing sensor histidine kinase [Kitasatospora herbaricolor]MDQ0307014.1 signal transduction histidine kinase [Kitasatospora herbaricolor]GGV18727.1 two-component sensor histidine kinase [Kitasatospora herbaricolor]
MNLRRQIAVTVAVVSFLVALTLGLLVHQASVRQHTDQARRSAEAALDSLLTAYSGTGVVVGQTAAVEEAAAGAPPPVTGLPTATGLPEELRRLAVQGHEGSMFGPGPHGTAMWAAAGSGGKVFSVRVDYREDERAVAELDRTILLSAALAVAVTVLAGVFAADRISSRLRTAARTARTIARGDLAARIGPLGGPRDEVADLAAAVDSMSSVLRGRLAGEQRFTADVAHELRTPLTGLLTAAELLPPGRPTELVRDRVRFLCGLTEDLLEVSRLDARAEPADLSVLPLGPLLTGITSAGPAVLLRIDGDAPVTTDPRRLDRIVSNLLANAHRHGLPPVEVRVAGTTVRIRDHGPGYPDDVLRDGPQRFRTGARERGNGHGLGLTIAQGHAEAIGVQLLLGNHPEGGAVAELRLPAGEPPDAAVPGEAVRAGERAALERPGEGT